MIVVNKQRTSLINMDHISCMHQVIDAHCKESEKQ